MDKNTHHRINSLLLGQSIRLACARHIPIRLHLIFNGNLCNSLNILLAKTIYLRFTLHSIYRMVFCYKTPRNQRNAKEKKTPSCAFDNNMYIYFKLNFLFHSFYLFKMLNQPSQFRTFHFYNIISATLISSCVRFIFCYRLHIVAFMYGLLSICTYSIDTEWSVSQAINLSVCNFSRAQNTSRKRKKTPFPSASHLSFALINALFRHCVDGHFAWTACSFFAETLKYI